MGSAFADDHVTYLAPLMQRSPYDALNLGNHELYQRNGHGLVSGAACPITALRDSGYIRSWHGRYLTSNTVWADTKEPVGSRFALLQGSHGTSLLVFGFLYNMEDHCDAVVVEDVATAIQSDWFNTALRQHSSQVNAIVVLAHMDYEDPLVRTILQQIRSVVRAALPIQFLTGHSHTRGWVQLDAFASSYEAGCKLNTLGFISLTQASETSPRSSSLIFHTADIDGNTAQFAGAVSMTPAHFATPSGNALSDQISNSLAHLGLDSVLGCSDKRYRVNAPLTEPDSLWSLYTRRVLPETLLQKDEQRPAWAIISTGALGYDIYPGNFTVGNAYTVSPYGNFWLIMPNLSGAILNLLKDKLSKRRMRNVEASSTVPAWLSTGLLRNSSQYDLVFCDFDQFSIEEALKKIPDVALGAAWKKPAVYQPGSNTSSVLVDWFRDRACSPSMWLV